MFIRRAQSTLEYAIIIGVVVSALIAMQTYMRRSVQGRLKQGADQIGQQYSAVDSEGLTYFERNAVGLENTTMESYTSTSQETASTIGQITVKTFRPPQ